MRRTLLTTAALAVCVLASAATAPFDSLALAQDKQPAAATQKPAITPRPPVLFSETWRLPPHTGEPDDVNMRFTPAVVTNPRIEVKLYGLDAKVIRAAVHDWLTASRHASAIAAVRGAHARHGGGGSLYIVLRRR